MCSKIKASSKKSVSQKKIVRNWAANIVKVSEQQDSEVTKNGEILTANC